MNDIRIDGRLEYKIDNIGFVSLSRNKDHCFEYKNGKELYSFIYVENGSLDYFFPETGKKEHLEKGTVFFIPKQLPYQTRYLEEKNTITIIIFDIAGDIPEPLRHPILQRSHDFADIFRTAAVENMHDPLFLASQIYALLSLLIGKHKREIPTKYRKLLPAIQEIHHHYYNSCKICHYAELCNMSESNFRKLFCEYTGKTPTQYRNWVRICQVKKMLRSGEFSVGEAAYLAGFSNMSFFYEIYRQYRQTE